MKIVELMCDYCEKRAKGDDCHFNLPKGWFVLGFHSQSFVAADDWRVTHHFCSSECLDRAIKITKAT